MKPLMRPLLALVFGFLGFAQLPLRAEPPYVAAAGLTAADEERDARELADRINAALNLRQEVTVTLLNDSSVVVSGKVTAQRYWLVITEHDGSEFRFRASLVAMVRIK